MTTSALVLGKICCYRGIALSTGENYTLLTLGDLLLIAERELGKAAEHIKDIISLSDAEVALTVPEVDPVEQAALCCAQIIHASLFPDANKRIGFECMCEMLARGGCPWPWVPEEGEAIATMINRLDSGSITEADFVDWVRTRVAVGELSMELTSSRDIGPQDGRLPQSGRPGH